MGWLDIKERISLPILTPEGIDAMIRSCCEKQGMNKKHSRTIHLNNYKEPIDNKETVNILEIEKIKFDIIRYMARSLLKDVNNEGRYKSSVSGSIMFSIDIEKEDLMKIVRMSNQDMKKTIGLKCSNIERFINYVYEENCNFTSEHNGIQPIYQVEKVPRDYKNHTGGLYPNCSYDKRIYLNPSFKNINTYIFLSKFIKKCIDKRIPFDMKGFGSLSHNEKSLDGMILYSSNIYFEKHLECLEEVIRENPDIMSTFGSPIYTGGVVNSPNGKAYYTIGAGLPMDDRPGSTYNDYIDSAINLTYLISLAMLIKDYFPSVVHEYRELDNETKKLIYRLCYLDRCPANELQEIGNKFTKQKETIRQLGYKILIDKKDNGKRKLKGHFSNSFKLVCSVLKFSDKEHTSTPIYADQIFLDFEDMLEKSLNDNVDESR